MLDSWASGDITPTPQNDANATFTRRLTREDGRVDWSESALSIERRVRALTPWPGAFTTWRGRTVKILGARSEERGARSERGALPGTVIGLDGGRVAVVCGDGALELVELQLEGRRRALASEFVAGYRDFVGATLGE